MPNTNIYGSMSPAIAIQDLRRRIKDLPSTAIPDPEEKSDGQVLTYDEQQEKWIALDPLVQSVNSVDPVNGNITLNLRNINDVSLTTPTDGQVLKYNQAQGKWVAGNGDLPTNIVYSADSAPSGSTSSIKVLLTEDNNQILPSTSIAAVDGLNDILTTTIKYTQQSLTDAQKSQARSNIGIDAAGFVSDVKINNSTVVTQGIANIPLGSSEAFGVVKAGSGISIVDGVISLALSQAEGEEF